MRVEADQRPFDVVPAQRLRQYFPMVSFRLRSFERWMRKGDSTILEMSYKVLLESAGFD